MNTKCLSNTCRNFIEVFYGLKKIPLEKTIFCFYENVELINLKLLHSSPMKFNGTFKSFRFKFRFLSIKFIFFSIFY